LLNVVGPVTWNSLLDSLRDPALGSDFRHMLKTQTYALLALHTVYATHTAQ